MLPISLIILHIKYYHNKLISIATTFTRITLVVTRGRHVHKIFIKCDSHMLTHCICY